MTQRSGSLWRVLMLAVGFAVFAHAQTGPRRDGNWWRIMDTPAKNSYMLGFFDGLVLGERFSYWQGASKAERVDPVLALKVKNSFSAAYKMLEDVTNGQVSDGLDSFYADYRNRRILVFDAVWLVLNTIAGKSDKEMQVMIENYKRNAAR